MAKKIIVIILVIINIVLLGIILFSVFTGWHCSFDDLDLDSVSTGISMDISAEEV